jgi:general stress protein YciG
MGGYRSGFGSMPEAARKAAASKGGKRAHRLGTAHTWDSDAAREAGRKGGRISAARRWGKKEQAA